jgi:hypothetical protein
MIQFRSWSRLLPDKSSEDMLHDTARDVPCRYPLPSPACRIDSEDPATYQEAIEHASKQGRDRGVYQPRFLHSHLHVPASLNRSMLEVR